MKKLLCQIAAVVFTSLAAGEALSEPNQSPHLTVELRDGSRVVGTSVTEKLKFHSTLLGDLKLDVKAIRSVECVSTNSAKLTTTNGDTLMASFLDKSVSVKAGFGKVELAVNSIRKLSVSVSRGKSDAGLVLYLAFDGSTIDSSGNGLNGTGHAINYENGINGQAARFNGEDSYVSVPKTPALDLSGPVTLEAWIKFEAGGTYSPRIFHRGNSYQIYTVGNGSQRRLVFSCTAGEIASGMVQAGRWTHVAGVYDGTTVKLYLNGMLAGSAPASGPLEVSDFDLNIGRNAENGTDLFRGTIDEAKIYNRALSPKEIREDFETNNKN